MQPSYVMQQPADTDHKTELVTSHACSMLFESRQNLIKEPGKQKYNETTIGRLLYDFSPETQGSNNHIIIKKQPKFRRFRSTVSRLNLFNKWPKDHLVQAKDLAAAGFIHLTEETKFKLDRHDRKICYADSCVCHHCGKVLKAWELNDNPWVEHARHYPQCEFVHSIMGKHFVAVVQYLEKFFEDINIPIDIIEDQLHKRGLTYDRCALLFQDNWEQDPAVMALVDVGFKLATVLESCQRITNNNGSLSTGALYEDIISHDAATDQQFSKKEQQKSNEEENNLAVLEKEIAECRQKQVCNICCDKVADMMFSPCGHLLTCLECANSIVDLCPVCRKKIKKVIRVYFN